MKPIINPWWIYFASKSEDVGCFLLTVGMMALCFLVVIKVVRVANECEIKFSKWIIVLSIICIIIGGLLPSEKTIYTMMTVEQITPNNIEAVGNTAQDLINYVVDKIDEITDDDNKDKKTSD